MGHEKKFSAGNFAPDSQPAGHTRDRYFLFQPAKVTSLSKRHFCRDENKK